ncbi:MAG: multicopper oxidase domain-containing protein [Anaerolineae bacterium]|nr:multicopper oxidase domain-containing protein [Anaerolineae bacterium]
MTKRNLLNRLLTFLMLASLLLASAPVIARDQAQSQGQGNQPDLEKWYKDKIQKEKVKKEKRITPADRQAAAEDGLTVEAMAAMPAAVAGDPPHYFSHPNYANSPLPTVISGTTTITVTGGIRKFVDGLAGLGEGGANNLGQFIPVAVPDTTTFAGSDYYEIAAIQYREQMHSDLAGETGLGTLLRGYVQLTGEMIPCTTGVELFNDPLDPLGTPVSTGYCGVTEPHYLGAAIAATKDRAVRILFRNLLPAGVGGNLFIPTDTTVMGSGMGPDLRGMPETEPQNPTCDSSSTVEKSVGCFTENRATVHLHGGISPWISDGTPHQWITPADELLPYPDAELLADPAAPDHFNAVENKGVSVEYVPDMWFDATGAPITACAGQLTCAELGATNNPGKGSQTYYWTNQQSARLMFYHDHAWGITRLNVYAGEAAPYIIGDPTEDSLISQGLIPGPADTIPLVVQDKTFVPSLAQIQVSDETWDYSRWGGEGNLWLPHVYSPAQNPGDPSGVNQFGRWAYGPWFWPPTNNISYGPIPNPYYEPACDPAVAGWCEPPLMPGTPYNSMGMEAFNDTPVVNGTVYPTITVDPKAYRLRFLNAASDRFFNLSFYQAVDANGVACDVATNPTPAAESTGVACTEVALNPDEVAAALLDPPGVFPTPVVGTEGPDWIQIGIEGGFLPAPVVIPPQPITWVTDPTVFNAGNVDQHSLLLGPAERADAIVDFSAFAGQTLILYNDAPAAFPARDPRYDYYTGNPDLRDTGGTPPTLPGYGPNIRTVMQIVVANTAPATAYDVAPLEAAFAHQPDGSGVFESSQHPIIVGQQAYNSAYGTSFTAMDGLVQIFDTSLTFNTLNTLSGTLTMSLQPKQIQDEMGEAFDREYGRMSGFLGLESPNPQAGVQNMILYPFVNPASELFDATNLPRTDVTVTPIATADDGSQIWKITHNGVDTHPIHFHLFDVQVLNRVGWDAIIRTVDPNERGWKETVRISPLEDTIVAVRPIVPVTPFDEVLPNSTRPLNPAMPTGSSLMFTNIDAFNNPTEPIVNVWTNFGWEYVWHCHILSHEEMDMMRPISVAGQPNAAPLLSGTSTLQGNSRSNVLTWTDGSSNETGFLVQRSLTNSGPWTDLATVAADVTTYTDVVGRNDVYWYRITAVNLVGYSATPGYSTITTSIMSNVVSLPGVTGTPPLSPNNLTAEAQPGPQVLLTWNDNASDETGFVIYRCTGAGCSTNPANFAPLITVGPKNGTGTVTYTDVTVMSGNTYTYRVWAVNAAGTSIDYATSNEVTIPTAPPAPLNVQATAIRRGNNARVTLTWEQVLNSDETGFTIQMATNTAFTANLVTDQVAANTLTWSSGNISRNTPYYFRVQAFNDAGPSAWTNAVPFPITTP